MGAQCDMRRLEVRRGECFEDTDAVEAILAAEPEEKGLKHPPSPLTTLGGPATTSHTEQERDNALGGELKLGAGALWGLLAASSVRRVARDQWSIAGDAASLPEHRQPLRRILCPSAGPGRKCFADILQDPPELPPEPCLGPAFMARTLVLPRLPDEAPMLGVGLVVEGPLGHHTTCRREAGRLRRATSPQEPRENDVAAVGKVCSHALFAMRAGKPRMMRCAAPSWDPPLADDHRTLIDHTECTSDAAFLLPSNRRAANTNPKTAADNRPSAYKTIGRQPRLPRIAPWRQPMATHRKHAQSECREKCAS